MESDTTVETVENREPVEYVAPNVPILGAQEAGYSSAVHDPLADAHNNAVGGEVEYEAV